MNCVDVKKTRSEISKSIISSKPRLLVNATLQCRIVIVYPSGPAPATGYSAGGAEGTGR